MNKRVKVHGTSRADMNGKRGVATDFHLVDADDPTTWRYSVKLDGGESFKLKLANVRAEGTSSNSNSDTAAKEAEPQEVSSLGPVSRGLCRDACMDGWDVGVV